MAGTASPLALCERAKEQGYTHLALTDRNNLYGLPAFLRACTATGIQPLIGAEIALAEPEIPVVCGLVLTSNGYANLCTLLTKRHCEKDFSFTSITKELSTGLVFLCEDISVLEMFKAKGIQVIADLGNKATTESRKLRTWARNNDIRATATLNSSIADESEELTYSLLQAIKNKSSLSSVNLKTTPNSLISSQQLQSNFAIWPEVFAATKQLGMCCSFRGPNFGIVMPSWQGETGESPVQALREQAYKGAQYRYGDDLGEVVVDRLEYELKVIDDMGFSSYFLIVRDIVHPLGKDGLRRKHRICGRGSGAASLVAYCLEITNVCPVRHNLYFERFLNPGRQDPPDIDIDFAWDERDQVLEETLEKYKGHAALVSNHVYFKSKMAIRETAKAFGIPGGEISQITQKLHLRGTGKENFQDDEIWGQIFHLSQKIVGIPRYLSVHPGGVIITPDRIDRYVPVEYATKGVPIIHWEKDGAEESGLIKIDILGNRSLGVIRDTITNLRGNGYQHEERDWLPEEDEATKKAVAKGATMGCFYIESPAMRLLQKKANTGDFEQLVLQSSIIRPAANDFVREYVRRFKGGRWEHLHPKLKSVLDDTFGLMVYQEDVSKVAVALAGFSHARADGLRKVLSKKDRELRLKDYQNEFSSGCISNNIEQDTIDNLWAMILSFDGYSFCKPHSASYAKVSYQAAYLKVHYPAEFMAAVISNQGGFYSTFGYVSEAKRLGIIINPPDVNASKYHWHGYSKNLQTGFQAIKGLSMGFIGRLTLARKEKIFIDVADFFYRTNPSENEGRALVHAGALDSLYAESRRELLLWEFAAFKKMNSAGNRLGLFAPSLPSPPDLPVQNEKTRFRYEYVYLGFLTKLHPLNMIDSKMNGIIKAKDIRANVGKTIMIHGWLLTGKIVSTKTGEAMEFLTFEDETDSFETTFFPRVYKKYAYLLESGKGYLLQGVVDEDFGAVTLTVSGIVSLFKK